MSLSVYPILKCWVGKEQTSKLLIQAIFGVKKLMKIVLVAKKNYKAYEASVSCKTTILPHGILILSHKIKKTKINKQTGKRNKQSIKILHKTCNLAVL